MGIREHESNVTSTIPKVVRSVLEIKAGMLGLSLSRYVAGILTEAARDMPDEAQTISVRQVREQHGSLSVTIPPETAKHLGLGAGKPIAFAPVPGGARIRLVR